MSKTLKLAKSLRRQYTQARKLRNDTRAFALIPQSDSMRRARIELRKGA